MLHRLLAGREARHGAKRRLAEKTNNDCGHCPVSAGKTRSWPSGLRQTRHYFSVLSFGKGSKSLGTSVALRTPAQGGPCGSFIIREFRDHHGIILPHGQVEADQLSASRGKVLLGSIEPRRTILDALDTFLREPVQQNVGWQGNTSGEQVYLKRGSPARRHAAQRNGKSA